MASENKIGTIKILEGQQAEEALQRSANYYRGQRDCTKMLWETAFGEMTKDSPTEIYVNRLWKAFPDTSILLEESSMLENNYHGFQITTIGDLGDWEKGAVFVTEESSVGGKSFDLWTVGLAMMTTTRMIKGASGKEMFIMRVPTFDAEHRLSKPVLENISEVTEMVMTGKTFDRLVKEISNTTMKYGEDGLYGEFRTIFADKNFNARGAVWNTMKTRYNSAKTKL